MNDSSQRRGIGMVFKYLLDNGLPAWARSLVAICAIVGGYWGSSILSDSQIHIATEIFFWSLMAASLNLVLGYAGQMSLALGAFMALGAYVGTLGTGYWDWSGGVSIIVAGVAALFISTLLSFVIFRAKELQFALLTAGISLVAYSIIVNWSDVTGGFSGLSTGGPLDQGGIPKSLTLGLFSFSTERDYLILILSCLASVLLGTTFLARSDLGRSWVAVRDDEVLAASLGVRVNVEKRRAFISSSIIAAIGGVLFAHWTGYISPDQFWFADASIRPLAMLIIGGAGTIVGPVVGAMIVIGLPELLHNAERGAILIYGILLLFVVMVMPLGVVGTLKKLLWHSWPWKLNRMTLYHKSDASKPAQ
jgi:branched-chain amino acid transport system permease protein